MFDISFLDLQAVARAVIFEYVEVWYKRRQRHSMLGYLNQEVDAAYAA